MDFIIAAVLTLLVDQGSKRRVVELCAGQRHQKNHGRPGFRLVRNDRISQGLIRNHGLLVAVWAGVALSIAALILYYPPMQHPQAQIGAGLAFGGATGNLLDLKLRGAVVDFIDLRVWPVFNIADVAIVFGAAYVVLQVTGLA